MNLINALPRNIIQEFNNIIVLNTSSIIDIVPDDDAMSIYYESKVVEAYELYKNVKGKHEGAKIKEKVLNEIKTSNFFRELPEIQKDIIKLVHSWEFFWYVQNVEKIISEFRYSITIMNLKIDKFIVIDTIFDHESYIFDYDDSNIYIDVITDHFKNDRFELNDDKINEIAWELITNINNFDENNFIENLANVSYDFQ